MGPILTSIAAGSPEFIFYPVFISEGGFITTKAKEISGLEDVVLAGADALISPNFLEAAGETAEGMYVSGPDLNFANSNYDDFLAKYEAKSGTAPTSAFHAHAYDATNLIFDGIETVGQEDADGNLIIGRQALRDFLYSTTDYTGLTGNLTCNELGDCADPKVAINQVQNGEFVQLGGAEAPAEEASDEEASDEEASDEEASDEEASDEEASDEEASDEEASDEEASDEEASADCEYGGLLEASKRLMT